MGTEFKEMGTRGKHIAGERTACASLEGARKESEVFERLERLAQVCGGLPGVGAPGGGQAMQGLQAVGNLDILFGVLSHGRS